MLYLKAKVVQIAQNTKKKTKKDDCYILMPQSPHKFKRVFYQRESVLANHE